MMVVITVYKIRPDCVFDGETQIEVDDPESAPIPDWLTTLSPDPIPNGHYAVIRGGQWLYVAGEKPAYPPASLIKAANKSQAEGLLLASDWVEYKSVRDTTRTPHLTNGDAWDDYRVALRGIAVNPPATEVADWPVKPDEVWSS